MKNAQKLILMLAATFAAGLLFVNVYTSVVDAPNWGREIPASINAAREYFRPANPGTFFRIVSPVNQMLTLLALIVCWRLGKRARVYCALALLTAICLDVFTFAYFYPRNQILFVDPIDSADALRAAWSQWTTMNWFRSGVAVLNIIFDFAALMLVSKNG